MKTIRDLKDYLQSVLDSLDNYNDDDKLDIKTNTYFINGSEFIATYDGFISTSWPVNEDAYDEDEDYDEDEER